MVLKRAFLFSRRSFIPIFFFPIDRYIEKIASPFYS